MRTGKSVVLCLAMLLTMLSPALAADTLKVKSLRIDGNLTFDFLAHKANPGWSVANSGLAKLYTEDGISKDSWSKQAGQSLNLDFAYRPSKRWTMSLGILAIGNYADRYWVPINDEHRLEDKNERIKWTHGEVAYKGDQLKAQLFGGIGHYHWEEEGDMFQLYPEQFDVFNYRRVSGRQVPRGLDVKYNWDYGKLELVTGAELVWGDQASTYGKYNWRIGYMNNAFIFKDAKISWGKTPNEHLKAYELTSKIDAFEALPIDLGVLYQPFRTGESYLYVTESGSNNTFTTANSTYTVATGTHQVNSGITSTSDAIGYKARIGLKMLPFADDLAFTYTHQGISAGNKNEYMGEMREDFTSFTNLSLQGIYRKPVIGPLPYLYEGTADNPGPIVTQPRARNDAFWVNFNNRQATIFKLTFNFDPTPSSWLYLWQPNILEDWNMNPREDASFALAFQYLARKYPTTTDRWYYRTRDDSILWEGEYDPTKEFWDFRPYGCWATTKWLHSFNAMIRLIPATSYKFWVNLKWGQDVATYSLAYTLKTDENKPITNYFLGTVSLDKKPYKASFTYGKDVWGPEDWHQGFGGTLDRLYKASFSRTWESAPFESTDSTLGLEYVGTREVDNQFLYPELGPMDEWRAFFNLHFGALVVFKEEEKAPVVVQQQPPTVNLTIPNPVFTPGTGDNPAVNFELEATDAKGFKNWEVNIFDADQNLVQSYQGDGQPPQELDWDGSDLATGGTAAEGDYNVVFTARNLSELTADTSPQAVTLKVPQLEMAKEILKEAPVEVKEEERGLVMNITSAVLFDFDKYNIKSDALKVLADVARVINLYPENKINVEGHTDATGAAAYNQKLSERRAASVYDFLAKHNVSEDRMTMTGYGKTRPIATNRTSQGRALNRRVEIIILKNNGDEKQVPIEKKTVRPI